MKNHQHDRTLDNDIYKVYQTSCRRCIHREKLHFHRSFFACAYHNDTFMATIHRGYCRSMTADDDQQMLASIYLEMLGGSEEDYEMRPEYINRTAWFTKRRNL